MLPKITAPEYTLILPSSKKKVKYRPFIVKEEKLLLMAVESKSEDEMKSAVEQIISNCTFGKCNPNDMPVVDIEFLFLQLRIKSKGEKTEYSFKCDKCGVSNDKSADLTKVKVVNGDRSNIIKLTSDIGLKMLPPSYKLAGNISSKMTTDDIFNVIVSSIESVYDGEEVTLAKDESKEDLLEFIESLSDTQFKDIKSYFDNLPALELELDFSCVGCKEKNNIKMRGLQNFLE